MPQSVEISEALFSGAYSAAEVMNRSVNRQVELWAHLGRCTERHLNGRQIHRLRAAAAPAISVAEALATVGTPAGRARLQAVLDARPFPHFNAIPGKSHLMERVDENATKTVGEFLNRKFVPISS